MNADLIHDWNIQMEHDQVLKLIKKYLNNQNLLKHMLAVEAVMGALAEQLNLGREAIETWRLAGLVHDLDYDETLHTPEQHGLIAARILSDLEFPEEMVQAILTHNPANGSERKSLLDKALYAADPVTGLIVAAALIHPARKLAAIDAQFVLNRFGEKHFAKGARRDQISACSEVGLTLEEFITISLRAMQQIAAELGL